MEKISNYLKYFIIKKINEDKGWKDIKIIISDSNVPGIYLLYFIKKVKENIKL
jgi:5'-3' exonuclease